MTPMELSSQLCDPLELTDASRVLEPSFGDGSFLVSIIEKLLKIGPGTREVRLHRIFTEQLFGVELDDDLYESAMALLESKYGPLPDGHHLRRNDFFKELYPHEFFDFIVGNPPFGGSFDVEIEDQLDREYGRWSGYKIKKETYSFFIAKALDLLKPHATLRFILSDTFLTINTMQGLRRRLASQCSNEIMALDFFSRETKYPMVVLTAVKQEATASLMINGISVEFEDIAKTTNFSWGINQDLIRYFQGDTLSKYVVCTGGMTIGRNEYFVRELTDDGTFFEPYDFTFYDKPVTLAEEISKARLGKISPAKQSQILRKEESGDTYRALLVKERVRPLKLQYPHPDYLPYNKANNAIVFAKPKHVIYWRDDGDAVLTYKKTGNWYLHGVGGKKYFKREGLTWQLISSRINMKYLPEGRILDSGAPCAFLREGVERKELWFILAWTLTDLATNILKTVINHTKNIQGKDVERLPYPWWVDKRDKSIIIHKTEELVRAAKAGECIARNDPRLAEIEKLFAMPQKLVSTPRTAERIVGHQATLFDH